MRARFGLVALGSLLAAGAPLGVATHPGVVLASACTGAWTVATPPTLGAGTQSRLSGLAAVASNDVWAVGSSSASGSSPGTLIEHFDGTSWSMVTSPAVTGELYGITALSTDDVWAVGTHGFSGPSLTEHWDGTSWSVVASPGSQPLVGLSGDASNDVWAVGGASFGGPPLAEHWNGSAWTSYALPTASSRENLNAVTVVSPKDAWAVGNQAAHILHWDGTGWHLVPGPVKNSFLYGLATVSATDVWTVGQTPIAGGGSLIEQWNGTAWIQLAAPSGFDERLQGVTVLAPNWVIAVGHRNANFDSNIKTVVLSWNGTAWKSVFSPNPGPKYNELLAVSGIHGTGDVWAVGFTSARFEANSSQLIEQRCS